MIYSRILVLNGTVDLWLSYKWFIRIFAFRRSFVCTTAIFSRMQSIVFILAYFRMHFNRFWKTNWNDWSFNTRKNCSSSFECNTSFESRFINISTIMIKSPYRITLRILNVAFMIMSCLNNSKICLTISARLWRHRRWRQIGTLPTGQVGQRQRQQEIRWVWNVALLL